MQAFATLHIIISRDGVDDADTLYVVVVDDVVDVVFVDVAYEDVDDDGWVCSTGAALPN